MLSIEELRENLDYDLVGVAAPESFDALPPEEHPASIFPDAKSVVVLGKRIRRGEFRSMEEGSLWRTPARLLVDLEDAVRYIEQTGYECVPYLPTPASTPPGFVENVGRARPAAPSTEEIRMPGRPVRAGQVKPNGVRLSVEYAAVLAGLGEIGYHGMFMSPSYGIRQRLGLLVTDMEIEPSVPVGQGAICDMCMECATMCPLQAISPDIYTEIELDNGTNMRIGMINAAACRACPNGVSGDSQYFAGAEELHFEVKNNQIVGDRPTIGGGDVPGRAARGGPAGRARGGGPSAPVTRGSLPNRLAAACGRACIAHFESRADTGYKLPFRAREPWGFRPDEERGW